MALMRSSITVSLMTLVSRILGFVRDVIIARFFGASGATDAFVLAFRIPNLLRRMFAEGSFSLAFVPLLSEYREKRTPGELKELLDAVSGILISALVVVVGLGMIFAPQLIQVFAFGFGAEDGRFELAVGMLRITFPYALLISLTAMAAGILNTFGRFAVPALTPALLNVSMILSVVVLQSQLQYPITSLAWGVLLGGIAQLLVQIPFLYRMGLLPRPRLMPKHGGIRKILKRMLPTLLGSSAGQLNILIDTMIASTLVVGSMSWLYYSDRLLEFPLGVFGIAISTVILPSLSRDNARNHAQAFSDTLDWGMRVGLMVALPAATGLMLLAGPITATLFGYGEFSENDIRMTSVSMVAYAAGLPAFIMVKVLAPGFYARGDTATPVRFALIAMGTNVVLNLLFVYLFTRYKWAPAHAGLALASSLAAYLNMSLMALRLKREAIMQPRATAWMRFIAAVVLGLLGLGAAVVFFNPAVDWWIDAPLMERVIRLGIVIVLGCLAYAAALVVCRLDRQVLRR